ncbi:MAG: methyltransferase domain-containing protein [Acidobacteriota bacterium]|nr:methyltransferase domain-containing protein [Acidobacteriota bacterium]
MSLLLDEHREYLSDRPRVDALRRAIHSTVRPGDVVLDLGCGTGLLGLMACEAGAGRVYAIDNSGMIQVARAIAKASPYADRITHLAGHSMSVDLPERADVLVFDQIGRLGFEAGLLEFARDARRRHLKPGARIMPGPVTIHAALASSAEIRSRVDFWNGRPAGIDCSPAFLTASNTGYPVDPAHVTLLSGAAPVIVLDPLAWDDEPLSGRARVTVSRSTLADGIAGWFDAELTPGVHMTNAPSSGTRINRRAAFLPFAAPIALEAGSEWSMTLRLLPADMILSWEIERADGSGRVAQSTWQGMLPTEEELARTRGTAVPTLTPRGRARKTVLDLCDGRRTVTAIEHDVAARHPELFGSPRDAAVFVAEVLAVYGHI